MANPSNRDLLRTLTRKEARVFYWKCYGLTYKEIGRKLDYGEDRINQLMGKVYEKLQVDKEGLTKSQRTELLYDIYWKEFKEIISGEYKNIDVWPINGERIQEESGNLADGLQDTTETNIVESSQDYESPESENPPRPSTVALVLADEKQSEEAEEDKPVPVIRIPSQRQLPPPPIHPIVRLLRLVIFSLVALGIIFGVGYFAFQMGQGTAPPASPVISSTDQVLAVTPPPSATPTLSSLTPSLVPTLTQTNTPLPTNTSIPTETPTKASPESVVTFSNGPSGDWAVRIYQTDDGNIILVNNHIVGGALFQEQQLDWVGINNLLQEGVPNYVTTVNLNRSGPAGWGFSLRQNETIVWGNEAAAENCRFCYAQTVLISPDNTVEEVNLKEFDKNNLGGSWTAKIIAADFGVIMVNGVAVTGSYSGRDFGWFDIGGLLYEGQDNIITVAIWNRDGNYSWDAALRRESTIVWGSNNAGNGQVGEVFFTTVIINGDGNVVP